jgi:hypothetical protein
MMIHVGLGLWGTRGSSGWSGRMVESKIERGRGGALLWKGRWWSLMQGLDKIWTLIIFPPSSKH